LTKEEDLLSEYLRWLTIEKGRSRATIEAYRRDLTALVHWTRDKGLSMDELAEHDLEAFVAARRASGDAASSVARGVASLRGWFAYLVDEGVLTNDPSARLRGGRRGRTLPKPLSEVEMATLLDSVPSLTARDKRDRALLELLYASGARVSEVTGLKLGDLDFDEELILLNGKGSKQRLVPLGPTVRRSLSDYLGPGGRKELVGRRRSDKVFVNARGGDLSRQGVDLIIANRALAAGIDRARVSAHVFRHSCATHMLAHGADVRVVQELLGHASIATTQLYTAVSVTTLQREYHHAHPRAHD